MAESEQQQDVPDVEEEEDGPKVAYKPPAEKTIEQILKTDDDDESLRKYKEQLLGTTSADNEFWPNDKRNVILRKMSVLFEESPDRTKEIDLGDKDQLKDMKFAIKEGAKYRLMITFNVQREIVSGLKFVNKVSRAIINAKEEFMVGSYGPRKDVYEYKTPVDEFPKGMMQRGSYSVKSVFTDDDRNELLAWTWNFELKKDWKD